ncbi:MAG: transcriptional regulator [Desulfitobacteriaceae bacterium]
MEDRMERHIYQFVEAELQNYKINKKLIEEFDREILYTGAKSGLGKDPTGRFPQNTTTDSTSVEAMRILFLEDKTLRAGYYVRAIEDVLELLSEQERKLVELKYFQGWLTDSGICSEMHISRVTLYRQKNNIVRKFAVRMAVM